MEMLLNYYKSEWAPNKNKQTTEGALDCACKSPNTRSKPLLCEGPSLKVGLH